MIASIRSVSGCTMRGIDLDDENRLVVMVGTLVQVVNAFDLVTQHALRTHTGAPPFSPPSHSASAANGRETGVVTLLVEHSKVGKVVGPKGGTLQQLRKKSGAIVTVEKEQVELSGVALRKVILDGSVAAMRW